MPLEKVRKCQDQPGPLSLETPDRRLEEDSHLGDFIADKKAILTIDAAINPVCAKPPPAWLASGTPRRGGVPGMRFGIGYEQTTTRGTRWPRYRSRASESADRGPRRCASSAPETVKDDSEASSIN